LWIIPVEGNADAHTFACLFEHDRVRRVGWNVDVITLREWHILAVYSEESFAFFPIKMLIESGVDVLLAHIACVERGNANLSARRVEILIVEQYLLRSAVVIKWLCLNIVNASLKTHFLCLNLVATKVQSFFGMNGLLASKTLRREILEILNCLFAKRKCAYSLL